MKGANRATLLMAVGTGYRGFETRRRKSHTPGCEDHVADHSRLFRRVSLRLGETGASARPTDERLRAFREEAEPELAALYFQYGRYLLIARSRPGTQAANATSRSSTWCGS